MAQRKRRNVPEPGQPTGTPAQDTGEAHESKGTVRENTEGRQEIRNKSLQIRREQNKDDKLAED